MRVLLDEPVPRSLKRLLPGHQVSTVQGRGWSSKENGELLALASQEFDVFVTADQNIPHQQNLKRFAIAVVVLVTASNRIGAYEPLADQLRDAVQRASQGTASVVTV